TGVADVALVTGDKDLRAAANRLWNSAAKHKLYITGSAGAMGAGESFGPDYVLPNTGYAESCAGCGMANFAHRMLQLEADADMADELERVLYNASLHAIALDGRSSYYRNPLTDKDHVRDNNWCCCPPVISRTIMHVGRYAYGRTDKDIYVNLYVGGEAAIGLKDNRVVLKVDTEYPWKPKVAIAVKESKAAEFALRLRMPGWSKGTKISLGGKPLARPTIEKGYTVIRRSWKPGDTIELEFDMPVMRMEAHPKIAANKGKVAIQRGPIVYGLEGLDNNGKPLVTLPKDPKFKVKFDGNLLGGVAVIKGKTAEGKTFTAIPFYALANREKSSQEVWLPQEGKTESPQGWEGRLYRQWRP
ncbi:MAG: glycoside hydrolase family 127 protein, partial [Phycisphaerae bacterium]|nr:glycoside hydrolase family 127 protein [Phycisphaerae bacterium]